MPHAEFPLIAFAGPAVEIVLHIGDNPRPILLVDERAERGEGVLQFIIPVAQLLFPLGGQIQAVGAQVPIPDPIV